MKNVILTAKVTFYAPVAAHDNFKAQVKVTCNMGINFFLPIDAPGVGKFGPGYILTFSVDTMAANNVTKDGITKTYINCKGVKITNIAPPTKEHNSDFDSLPDVVIHTAAETTNPTQSVVRV